MLGIRLRPLQRPYLSSTRGLARAISYRYDPSANARAFSSNKLDDFVQAPPDGTVQAIHGSSSKMNMLRENIDDFERETILADHSWRQQNRIWTNDEIAVIMAEKNKKLHIPVTFSDKVMRGIMQTLYRGFNFITGYREENPPTKSIEWRLIVLESFAGVPGFLAAAFRHFYSLRTMQRDHGAIFTLLEEAENERMHLLVCMKMFEANLLTRAMVITAQVTMTPFLMAVWMIKPGALHRFVAYLEETAVHTYFNIIKQCDTPGTHLNKDWAKLPAPDIAKAYWRLQPDATWRETLGHILADEAHHRDVNHAFASLGPGVENPFIHVHQRNFDAALIRRSSQLATSADPKTSEEHARDEDAQFYGDVSPYRRSEVKTAAVK